MDKMTVKQAADRWGLSVRGVQDLCRRGRIPGTEQWGRVWMIPADAQKPADNRVKKSKKSKKKSVHVPDWEMPMQTPTLFASTFYNSSGSAAKCLEELADQPEAAALFEAWYRLMQGDAKEAVELTRPLLKYKADFYGTLGIGSLLCACALWLGDMQLFREGRTYMAGAVCMNEDERKIRDYWIAMAESGLLDIFAFEDWPDLMGNFEHLPQDSYPAALFHYAKYIHKTAKNLARGVLNIPDMGKRGLIRVYPFFIEPLMKQMGRPGSVYVEIVLRLLCADAYYCMNDRENAIRHLDEAIRLAVPDKLYGTLAEFRVLYSALFDERLSLLDQEAVKEVKSLYQKIKDNMMKMKNRPLAAALTDREFQIAQLIALGMTNQAIAKRLYISENTVKTTVSTVMNKTGVKRRSEIGLHIL